MHILHLSSAHSRNDVRIVYKMARYTNSSPEFCSSVLLADGIAKQYIEGVAVESVGRPSSRLSRFVVTPLVLVIRILRIKPKIVHFHDPELLFLSLLLRIFGMKTVYDAHEDLPKQISGKRWLPKRIRPLLSSVAGNVELFLARFTSGIVGATEKISSRFTFKSSSRVVTIENFPDIDFFGQCKHELIERDRSAVCYVGGLSKDRGILEVIEAVSKLDGVTLYLAGPWLEPDFEKECKSADGWCNVKYLGMLDREGVRELLFRCSVGLVTLHPTRSYLESRPVKLYEYMAAGLPVVGSNFPEWRSLLIDSGAGIAVDPRDVNEIAQALKTLLSNMSLWNEASSSGRLFVCEGCSWLAEQEKLRNFYLHILGGSGKT